MRNHILIIWIAFCLVFFIPVSVKSYPYISFDLDTGQILRHREAFRRSYPASLTKLMTAYVVFHSLRFGDVALDSLIRFSQRAANQPPRKIGAKPGSVLTLDHALKMILTRSANDVAVAVAENIAGSVQAFVMRMNESAQHLGMIGTHYVDPVGFFSPQQFTTARDQALLVLAIRYEFPEYAHYFSIEAISYEGKNIENTNLLIGRYPGADGMKTGFICESGFNLVASATRGSRTLVSITLGKRSIIESAETAAALLDEGFSGFVLPSVEVRKLEFYGNKTHIPVNLRKVLCVGKGGGFPEPSMKNLKSGFLESLPGGRDYPQVFLQFLNPSKKTHSSSRKIIPE